MKISLMALCVFLSVAIQLDSFEKRAISAAQRIPASNLDAKLPNRSFVEWLNDLVGHGAGVVWQLSECGVINAAENGQDAPACAEAIALLPNGDKVIVGISVGTFKKGLIGEPAFRGAVIKSGERFYQFRRLSDLQRTLRPSRGVQRSSDPPDLSLLDADSLQMAPLYTMNPPGLGDDNSALRFPAPAADEAPPPPTSLRNSGNLVGANVITSVKPAYPLAARNRGLSGKVDVRVVISEMGRVVDAKALNGPMMLQGAAIAAARQWVYKPATLNGAPVKTESVLTFTFGPDQ
ncbi:MAG TPA: energy transducer TonB [Blastocatellia bacterium]|jgi:TonB family protein